eukprot:scaffold208627_cov33-Tisochrysis_lutea.AAC.2
MSTTGRLAFRFAPESEFSPEIIWIRCGSSDDNGRKMDAIHSFRSQTYLCKVWDVQSTGGYERAPRSGRL